MSETPNENTLELKDLIPCESEVELIVDGKRRKYLLRPLDLRDEAWLDQKFGSARIEEIFNKLIMTDISKIVFRLLRDKGDFKAIDVEEYNDDGELKKVRLTGPERLMEAIQGKQHQIEILQGLLATMGFSRPILSKLEEQEVKNNKKKEETNLVKNKTTGGESLTKSPASTDTPLTNSVASP